MPLMLLMHWYCWCADAAEVLMGWCTDAADALMLLNQDQDLLADLSKAICSSYHIGHHPYQHSLWKPAPLPANYRPSLQHSAKPLPMLACCASWHFKFVCGVWAKFQIPLSAEHSSIAASIHPEKHLCLRTPLTHFASSLWSNVWKSLRTLCDSPETPTEWKCETGTNLPESIAVQCRLERRPVRIVHVILFHLAARSAWQSNNYRWLRLYITGALT